MSTTTALGPRLKPSEDTLVSDQLSDNGMPMFLKPEAASTRLSSRLPQYEVDWNEQNAAENPRNWSFGYKAFVLLTVSWATLMSVVVATAYTSATKPLQERFDEPDETIVTLGLTFYLFGWIFGSLLFAPLSETYGRRWVYIVTNAIFIVLLIPTNLAGSLAGIIVSRFFCAIFSAGAIALSPGTISDVANDEQRALAYSVWSIGPFIAPAIGPIFAGFTVQYLDWQWIVWIAMVGSALSLFALLFVRESYSPVLLRHKAAAMRAETSDNRWWSRYDEVDSLSTKLKTSLRRPFILSLTEPMLVLWNLYIGLIYGILYLSFTAYPVVFQTIRGWSISITGLSFLGLGTGSFITIISEPLIRRLIQSQKRDPDTGKPAPEASVSIVCISAILLPIGEFWFAWTSAPPTHWIWPILSGIPFGMGATANFIYALNYLAYSYGRFAASVMAGNTVWRCLFGGTLPLAGPALILRLGPHWAGSLLAFLLTAMAPIPFLFLIYGRQIREKSTTITALMAEERK